LFSLKDQSLELLYLEGNNELYCWQRDYIQPFFEVNYFSASDTCSDIDDNEDFDADGISNRNELNNGTDPTQKNTQPITEQPESNSGGGSMSCFLLLLIISVRCMQGKKKIGLMFN